MLDLPLDKISIIIVTFNAKQTLRLALKSVLNQKYHNLELVVIDGKSTDGTLDILKAYDTQITYWVSEPDRGIYDAMNKGIAAATGKWLLFLGADDELCENILTEIFEVAPGNAVDLLYGTVKIAGSSNLLGSCSSAEQIIEHNVPHQAMFYSRSLLQRLNGYNLRYKILADYDLNLRIFEDLSIEKKFIDHPVAVFSSKGISNRTIDYTFFSEKLSWFTTTKGLLKTDPRLAKYYFFTGVALILKKQYKAGFKKILHPLVYSKRRFFYLLLTGDFFLSLAGLRKKYTCL